MAGKRKSVMQPLLFYICMFFFNFMRVLPLSVARKSGVALARIAYHLVPRIKRVGMENLDVAYGDSLDREQKESILKGSVENLGLVAVEFYYVPLLPRKLPEMNIPVKGFDNIDRSQGGILISAHMGNWEWLLPVGAHLGLDAIVIVREFDDPRMNAFVDGMRRASGIKTIPKDAAMGPLLRRLKGGAYAGLLADQNPREDAVPVRFFGAPTWATIGPAIMAMRANVPVYPVSIVREPNGNYSVEFFQALELAYSGDTLTDLQTNTQRCQDALEAIIRNHPEQWLWFHRRWKKRERLEREWAERLANRKRKNDTQPECSASKEIQ
ncbi:MAG TPA: hypothetical protein ENN29_08880 [Candidatus Hydrogenedentes bacterium]|nr:hypothetical protein [Candidatus Hydrogenedentota bacterium]